MPKPITDISILQKYLVGVLERAAHHAGNVNEIIVAIAGAIVWRKDGAPIQVLAKQGEMKNVLWVSISGKRYAFTYDHPTQSIQIVQGTTHGVVLHSLTNATPLSKLIGIFKSL
jgi:hypothetical protein